MEVSYTSCLRQMSDLSDIYYISCVESVERDHGIFRMEHAPIVFLLAASMVYNVNTYSAPAVRIPKIDDIRVEWVAQLAKGYQSRDKVSSVNEGNISIEVSQSPVFKNRSKREDDIDSARLAQRARYESLIESYKKNKREEMPPYRSIWTMRVANTSLCKLPFEDAILQYDQFDDIWQYNLFFANNLELTVCTYVEESGFENVDFNIYHGDELLVADTMSLPTLVKRMNSIIAKVDKNA